MVATIILPISRNERRVVHSFIYQFLVTLSYIFENVKILTGQKFDISFLLEVPLLSGETMAILASSGKMSFDKLLFITFGKG